jgi:MFS family permease
MFLHNLQGRGLTIAITITCGTGFLLFGYDQGVFGGLLSNNVFLGTFGNPNATIQGQIVSTYDIGCILGAISSIFFGDKLGRRRSIIQGCCLVIIGGTIRKYSGALFLLDFLAIPPKGTQYSWSTKSQAFSDASITLRLRPITCHR